MAVTFQDYYERLGVARDAKPEEMQRAYRKLARKLHPDVNKAPDAGKRFAEIAEAYEVLKDPEKRKRYDTLGRNWKTGDEFTPPPGWERGGFEFSGPGEVDFDVGDLGGFSSFFESLFGGGTRRGFRTAPRPRKGRSVEAAITISIADAYRGATRSMNFETIERDEDGVARRAQRTYDVRIPPGTTEGSQIRLKGQGAPGTGGGAPGDLFLRVSIAPDPRFRLAGHDLETILALAPHEAALGARVPVPTMDGEALLRIPVGFSSGKRLRMRGMGLPRRGGTRGDLIVELRIVVPAEPSAEERELYERLGQVSRFDPRARS